MTYEKDPRLDAYIDRLPINVPALTQLFRNIIANNRAGGWRKIKAAQGL